MLLGYPQSYISFTSLPVKCLPDEQWSDCREEKQRKRRKKKDKWLQADRAQHSVKSLEFLNFVLVTVASNVFGTGSDMRGFIRGDRSVLSHIWWPAEVKLSLLKKQKKLFSSSPGTSSFYVVFHKLLLC